MSVLQMLIDWVKASPSDRNFMIHTQKDPHGHQEVWIELYDENAGQQMLSAGLAVATEDVAVKALKGKMGQLATVDAVVVPASAEQGTPE